MYFIGSASAADLLYSRIRGIETSRLGLESRLGGGWQAGRDAWQAGRLDGWQAGRLGGREGQNVRATVQFELDIGWKGQKVIRPVGTLRNGLEPLGAEGSPPCGGLKERAGAPIKKNC